MNRLKITFLLTCLTLLLVAMGSTIGGQSGMSIAFALACGMNFFSYWYSDKIILKMYKAREVSESENPAFHSMVRRLAQQANMPMPKVYIIASEGPNAFATGRNPQNAAVAATEGILRILSAEELEGVMAHELAHVQNRDTLISTIAATFAGAISMLGSMLQWATIFGAGRNEDEEVAEGGCSADWPWRSSRPWLSPGGECPTRVQQRPRLPPAGPLQTPLGNGQKSMNIRRQRPVVWPMSINRRTENA